MSTPTYDTSISHPITVGSAEFTADPHRYYDWLRREAPVYCGRVSYLPDQDAYLLSRYDDCVNLTTDPRIRRVVEDAEPLPLPAALRLVTTDGMIYKDEPEHLRLRRLVSRPFTPRAISRLGDRVEAVTAELLDGMEPGQEIDLQQAYALPVPVTVINEMVGVPDEDRSTFHDYIQLLIEGISAYGLEAAAERMEGLIDYVRGLIDRRRADPGEDIMTGLIQASEGGDRLSDDEVVAMVFLLVTAGYETTYNLITNGVATLLQHPDQLALLRERPELISTAVEEILRHSGTVGGTEPTYAAEDVTLHDVTIPRGAMVVPLLAAANRDPAVFDRPDEFDITRSPNPHIAFSKGAHFCLGASLARMETRIALANFVERFPGTRLAVAPEELIPLAVPLMNRLPGLPVVLG
ncbi:MAG: cytochrome P450 family protein [Pseudonocardia sp.]